MITLKADVKYSIGSIKVDEEWVEITPWTKRELLGDWIASLEQLQREALDDDKIFSSWLRFKENNNLTGLAKVFVDESKFVKVSNKILEVVIPIRPISVGMTQVKEAFQEFCGIKNVVLMARVSPNTKT